MKDPVKVARGRSARALGADFERRVRIDLEENGWIVDKWSNQVQFAKINTAFPITSISDNMAKLIPAKHKFQQNGIPFTIGVGFPDFIAFRELGDKSLYTIIGIECKMNGKLSKEEKEKCRWLLDNKIFLTIHIAEKTKVKGKIVIVYHDFEEKYGS